MNDNPNTPKIEPPYTAINGRVWVDGRMLTILERSQGLAEAEATLYNAIWSRGFEAGEGYASARAVSDGGTK